MRLLGFAPDARVLIVNCDDFGIHDAVNAAVVESIENGIASSCSLMVPCPAAANAMRLLRERPHIPFGIHLALTRDSPEYRWGPAAAKADVPSLLDPDSDELYVDTPAQRSALLALRGRSSIVPTKCPDYKFPLVYRHRVDVPDFDTVLSPAVKLVRPKFLAGLSLGDNVGRVEFDTTMDTTVNAATVVSVVGCGATIERLSG